MCSGGHIGGGGGAPELEEGDVEAVEACGGQGRTEGESPAGEGRGRRMVGKTDGQTTAMTLLLVESSSRQDAIFHFIIESQCSQTFTVASSELH